MTTSALVSDVKQLEQALVKLERKVHGAARPELTASVRSLKTNVADPSHDVATEAVALSTPWTGKPLRVLKRAITADCQTLS